MHFSCKPTRPSFSSSLKSVLALQLKLAAAQQPIKTEEQSPHAFVDDDFGITSTNPSCYLSLQPREAGSGGGKYARTAL